VENKKFDSERRRLKQYREQASAQPDSFHSLNLDTIERAYRKWYSTAKLKQMLKSMMATINCKGTRLRAEKYPDVDVKIELISNVQ
jgi:hypothetical protein